MSYNREYYQRNKERINARARRRYHDPAWRAAHYDEWLASRRRATEDRRRFLTRTCLECGEPYQKHYWRKFCSETCAATNKAKRVKELRATPEARARINRVSRARYHQSPFARLRHIVSNCVKRALWVRKPRKQNRAVLDALPYTIPQLKAHIESQFTNENGFTWENRGTVWHMDHIIPQSVFAYTALDSKAFRDCWALSNLRPLAVRDNQRKHANQDAL